MSHPQLFTMATSNENSPPGRKLRRTPRNSAVDLASPTDSSTDQSIPYVYQPLSLGNGFRLLTVLPGKSADAIHCTVQEYPLDSPPSFSALSYTWGSADSSADIVVEGYFLTVRQNLHDALKALRMPRQPLTIWVDALCINQADIDERNHQVARMWSIYHKASCVLVWLGCIEANTVDLQTPNLEKVLQIKRVSAKSFGLNPAFLIHSFDRIPAPSLPMIEPVFQKLVVSPYWNRGWVRQEALAASSLLICFGEYKLDEQTFFNACIKCRNYRLTLSGSPDHLRQAFRYPYIWNIIESRRKHFTGDDLKSLITKYGMSACEDPRDRIFCLLGLAHNWRGAASQPWHDLHADYSLTNEQVFERFRSCGPSKANGIDWDFENHLRQCLGLSRGKIAKRRRATVLKSEKVAEPPDND